MPVIREIAMRMSEPICETRLSIRVQPRASKNRVAGWIGETLKVKLTAPPVEGAANEACLAFLSHLLHIPASRLTVLKGEHSRDKVVRILGMAQNEVYHRLGRPALVALSEAPASRERT